MRDIAKDTIKCVIMLLAACVAGSILLVAAYLLPNGHMIMNGLVSAAQLEDDPGYTYGIFEDRTLKDTFTDALILRKAVYGESGQPLNDAMQVPSYSAKAKDQAKRLEKSVLKTGKKEGKIDNYPRYWHGYLLFIKPALIFFNISQIYAINTIIVFGLFIAALFFVYKYAGTGGAVSLLAALGVVNPVSVASCLQYTPVYVITLMAVIGAAVLPEKYRSLLFCGAGILTAYFDLLTAPLVTLGIPLVLVLTLNVRCGKNLKENCLETAADSVFWGAGYGGMWFMKWVIASVILRRNVIADALEQILFRTSGSHEGLDISFAGALKVNYLHIINPVAMLFFAGALACFIAFSVIKKRGIRVDAEAVVPVLIVGIYPAIWYGLLKNHSVIHNWFTFRSVSVSVYAVFSAVYLSIKNPAEYYYSGH